MREETQQLGIWVVLQPCKDIPGEWLAHCLNYDLYSQGHSLRHAVAMLIEALGLVLVEELKEGRMLEERRAPAQYWDEMFEVLRQGRSSNGIPTNGPAGSVAVAHVQVELTVEYADAANNNDIFEPSASVYQTSAQSWTQAQLSC